MKREWYLTSRDKGFKIDYINILKSGIKYSHDQTKCSEFVGYAPMRFRRCIKKQNLERKETPTNRYDFWIILVLVESSDSFLVLMKPVVAMWILSTWLFEDVFRLFSLTEYFEKCQSRIWSDFREPDVLIFSFSQFFFF